MRQNEKRGLNRLDGKESYKLAEFLKDVVTQERINREMLSPPVLAVMATSELGFAVTEHNVEHAMRNTELTNPLSKEGLFSLDEVRKQHQADYKAMGKRLEALELDMAKLRSSSSS